MGRLSQSRWHHHTPPPSPRLALWTQLVTLGRLLNFSVSSSVNKNNNMGPKPLLLGILWNLKVLNYRKAIQYLFRIFCITLQGLGSTL